MEKWAPHPRWLRYEVSTFGRVRNVETGNLIGRGRDTSGYRRVSIRRARHVHVSAMVLETFVGPRPAGHDADHINHDHTDDRLRNLRWRPLSENRADHIRQAKTHCPSRHAQTPETSTVNSAGHRICRICARAATARWRARQRAR